MTTPIVRCQFCGAPKYEGHVERHEAACLDNPAVLEELRRLLDDGTGRSIRRRDYLELPDTKPASDKRIADRFHSWDNLARALGLRVADKAPKVGINAPLTDDERFCCQRRLAVERGYYPSK